MDPITFVGGSLAIYAGKKMMDGIGNAAYNYWYPPEPPKPRVIQRQIREVHTPGGHQFRNIRERETRHQPI